MNVNSLLPQSPPPTYALFWFLSNYFSTTAFSKIPCSKPRPIFFPTEGCDCNQGREQQIWVTPVFRLAGTQNLAASQTGLCVTFAHLSEIFFLRLSIIIFEHCILALGSPEQAVAKINPVLQLLPWHSSSSLSTSRLFKDVVPFFLEYSYTPE